MLVHTQYWTEESTVFPDLVRFVLTILLLQPRVWALQLGPLDWKSSVPKIRSEEEGEGAICDGACSKMLMKIQG